MTPLAGEGAAPKIRGDLLIEASAQPGVFNVSASGGQVYALKDFEVSIARMLDGRTEAQVADSAAQIGIPLNLDSLRRFIGRLRSYGFIDDGTAPAAAFDSRRTWPPRPQWNDEERQLFQRALKLYREEQFAEAKAALEPMIARRPDALEAHQLMANIQQAIGTGVSPTGSFAKAFNEAESSWFADGEASSRKWEAIAQQASDDEDEPRIQRSRRGLWVIVGLAVIAAAAMFPVSREVEVPFRVVAEKQTPIPFGHAGTLESIAVKEGQTVKEGEVLARFETASDAKRLKGTRARIAELQQKIQHLEALARTPKAVKARAQQEKREAALRKALAAKDKLLPQKKGKKSSATAKAEKQVAIAEAAVKKGAAELEALTQGKALETARQDLKTKTEEREALQAEISAPVLKAPAAGVVVGLTAKAGQPIAANDVFAHLLDPGSLRAHWAIPDAQRDSVHAGEVVDLLLAGHSVAGTIASVGDSKEGSVPLSASASASASPDWKLDASGTARMTLGNQPLWERLLRSSH